MLEQSWDVGMVAYRDRMPPLPADALDEAQRRVADALIAGPRKGVKGPFVPLLRSPELVDRLQKVGEYLRFGSALDARLGEFVMLIVSRQWTNQFEWHTHVPLAREAGLGEDAIAALAEGRRPPRMTEDEETAYDFCDELLRTRGVSETTYNRARGRMGEKGVIDLVCLVGYFTMVCMVMNVAHTPPLGSASGAVPPLMPYPL